jgi:hypothetical protein
MALLLAPSTIHNSIIDRSTIDGAATGSLHNNSIIGRSTIDGASAGSLHNNSIIGRSTIDGSVRDNCAISRFL